MECRDFQKLIPKIIDDDIPEEDLENPVRTVMMKWKYTMCLSMDSEKMTIMII